MTRLWPNGEPITVDCDASGNPQCLTWKGQIHPISEVANTWAVDDSWWQRHLWRDYFTLTTEIGLLLTIYCDLLTNEWYVERLYN